MWGGKAGWPAQGEAPGDGAFWLQSLPRQDLPAVVDRWHFSPPGLAQAGSGSSQRAQGSVLQHYGFQIFPLGFSISFHFHCNKLLQCAVVGADLLLEPMQSREPGEAPWEGNVYHLNLIPLLEKNLSLHLSPCKDGDNVWSLHRGTKKGSEDTSCAVLDISVLS